MKKCSLFSGLIDSCDLTIPVDRLTISRFSVFVETNKGSGLSSCFRTPNELLSESDSELRKYKDNTIADLIALYDSDNLLYKSIAMAALNAVQSPPPPNLPSLYGQDLLLEKTGNGHLVIVGAFPFLESCRGKVGKLSLIQEEPHLGYLGIEKAKILFPQAQTVVITASAFVNGTIDALINLVEDSYLIILGPTTPLNTYLFDKGVDALCGVIVEDSNMVFEDVINDVSFRKLKGVRRVTWINNIIS